MVPTFEWFLLPSDLEYLGARDFRVSFQSPFKDKRVMLQLQTPTGTLLSRFWELHRKADNSEMRSQSERLLQIRSARKTNHEDTHQQTRCAPDSCQYKRALRNLTDLDDLSYETFGSLSVLLPAAEWHL